MNVDTGVMDAEIDDLELISAIFGRLSRRAICTQ